MASLLFASYTFCFFVHCSICVANNLDIFVYLF